MCIPVQGSCDAWPKKKTMAMHVTARVIKLSLMRFANNFYVLLPAHFTGVVCWPAAYPTRIVFKSRGRILFLRVAEIRWIGAEENYVRISTATETHLLRETMSAIEEKLDPQTFLRVHRSAIVNLHFVKEVRTEAQGDFAVLLTNGQKVAMSRSYHSRVRAMLENA
jgi:DNA-binding LytR/AlgR family response regulator